MAGGGRYLLVKPLDDSAFPVRESTLPNGLCVLSQTVPYVRTVSIGFWIGVGSRHETLEESGASHFVEHLLFKGTLGRSAREISETIDGFGGFMNAYTAKEYTCLYARVPQEHLWAVLDLLADMLLHSRFDALDIEKEKGVILEEIASYEDDPEGVVHDLFYDTLWPCHPLGRPIVGDPALVKGLNRQTLVEFFATHYTPGKVVLSAVGNLDHDALVNEANGLLGKWRGGDPPHRDAAPQPVSRDLSSHRDTEQVHFCLGFPGVSLGHPDAYSLTLLGEIAGGGSSSRLFQKVREEMGLVYSIYTSCGQYSDGGTFLAYAGAGDGTWSGN